MFTIKAIHILVACMLIAMCCRITAAEHNTITVAAEIGITPKSLVVADAEEHANTVLTLVVSAPDLRATLDTARSELNTAAMASRMATRASAEHPGDSDLAAAYQTARAVLETKRSAYTTARNGLFAHVTAGLSDAQRTYLVRWQSSARFRVPDSFRVLQRTDEHWKAIGRALRAERRAAKRGDQLDPAMASLLANIRAEFDVIAAQNRLLAYLPQVETVFESFE